jgi:hypothetical protein
MTVSTAVITVFHSEEAVHIPHASRSSLIAGYPLYRRVPLHTSGVCARTSLQGCSMVSPSFSVPAEVSLDVSVQITKGPLLRHVVLRRVRSLTHSFPTRQIPRESTQSTPLIGTPNKILPDTTPGRTHIGSWLYFFHGWSLHEPVLRFGYDNYHMLLESTRHSPKLSESTEHNSKPGTPNPYSSH